MIMKKNLFLAALAIVALASCSDNEFVGNDNSPDEINNQGNQAIVFNSGANAMTRADIMGSAAADLLGKNFYVVGTKGTEAETYPTKDIVFNNYLVHYGVNTAGTTESNTANWEYVGIIPGTTTGCENNVKLSSLDIQTIKFWDYSTTQYDFFAFSTGKHKAVSSTSPSTGEIGVTASKYGEALKGEGVAYTFYIPDVAAIKNAYITDITEVMKANYGKEVTLKFKNLGSKVRVALYETVPGYSVKDVVFYSVDGINDFTDAAKDGAAKLISADENGLPTNGSIQVYFPHVGSNNDTKADYNKASATVTSPGSGATYDKFKNFQNLTAQLTGKDPNGYEANDNVYLGRSLPSATFAGDADAAFYQTVFPVSSSSPLTLRVDYTLVSIDGSGEEIKIYGAKAVVPATYTVWLPNYAYTYIFKISDNTNGWTDPSGSEPAGLFPITFDAVVTEATDATDEQKTITTVSAPSITTYQQNHDLSQDEYSIATGKDVYVQVMKDGALVDDLNATVPGVTTKRSRLYAVTNTGTTISEATVMDALENRTNATIEGLPVIGRNGIKLAHNTNINPAVTSIVNGADDNPIAVNAGEAAMITIGSLAAGTYAYVYDYTDAAKNVTTIYQPFTPNFYLPINTKYITTAQLEAITGVTMANEAVDDDYIYFSKTTNGTGTETYSYVSVDGKEKLPAGLLKFKVSDLETASDDPAALTHSSIAAFAFKLYYRNDGKYAVKVIKVVD